jgi:hypothetical protein
MPAHRPLNIPCNQIAGCLARASLLRFASTPSRQVLLPSRGLVFTEFAQTRINVSIESSSRFAVTDHVDIGHRIASSSGFL